ncbi:MAG TPA: alpha/beta fold hydrolase [Acidimicrobiia bacterium]|nr:alpha/beta fold hydrolase [Acidimicrobiia bacterium]
MAVDGMVLVHGGMHGGWCWEDVIPLLDTPGVAVDLPGRGTRPLDGRPVTLARCVDAVIEDADAAGFGRFVLVGHSMGGLTITETANRFPERVAALVYVAALAPPPGCTVFQLYFQDDAPPIDDLTAVQPVMAREQAWLQFAADLDEVAFDRMYARCVPEPIGLFAEGVTGYGSGVPATYIRCTRDGAVPAELTDMMLTHLAPGRVIELDADHDVMLSNPSGLAAILDQIARDA